MTEKLNNILFHPSRIGQYKNVNIFKVLLYLFILSIFSIIITVIDIVSNPELTIAHKNQVETYTGFDFDIASDLPSCSLKDKVYTCAEGATEPQELGTVFNMIKVVSDVNDEMQSSGYFYYLKFTKNQIIFKDRIGAHYRIPYEDLPSKWQNFDFEAIKNSSHPSDELFKLFIGGYNQVIRKFTPYILIINILVTFVLKLLELLFFSIFFYLLYRRFNFKYLQLFKITVFAQTLPITLVVIFNLLGINVFVSFFATLLTFIYVYLAVIHNIPRSREF
jgi:hypothetical protein